MRIEALRHHTTLERKIAELTGATPFDVRTFIATGLIVTVSAALGRRSKRQDEAWAVSLLESL